MQHPLVIQIEDAQWEQLKEAAAARGLSIEQMVLQIIKEGLA